MVGFESSPAVSEEISQLIRFASTAPFVHRVDDLALAAFGQLAAFACFGHGFMGQLLFAGLDQIVIGELHFLHHGVQRLGSLFHGIFFVWRTAHILG